jgi:choline transport protein
MRLATPFDVPNIAHSYHRWQTYLASVCFLVGTIIQGLITLNAPTYVFQRWHGTLLAIAAVIFSIAFNTVMASQLPKIGMFNKKQAVVCCSADSVPEAGILCLHIGGFFAVIITLLVMAPKGKADVVLLQFTNNGGWSTTGLSSMIGLLAPQAVLVGYDCCVHMAEEIRDASVTVPRALMGSVILNVTMVFVVIVTLCFTIGDTADVLGSATGYPFIQVFFNATQSYAGTNVLTVIIIIMMAACAVSEVAAASRQIWYEASA